MLFKYINVRARVCVCVCARIRHMTPTHSIWSFVKSIAQTWTDLKQLKSLSLPHLLSQWTNFWYSESLCPDQWVHKIPNSLREECIHQLLNTAQLGLHHYYVGNILFLMETISWKTWKIFLFLLLNNNFLKGV